LNPGPYGTEALESWGYHFQNHHFN